MPDERAQDTGEHSHREGIEGEGHIEGLARVVHQVQFHVFDRRCRGEGQGRGGAMVSAARVDRAHDGC